MVPSAKLQTIFTETKCCFRYIEEGRQYFLFLAEWVGTSMCVHASKILSPTPTTRVQVAMAPPKCLLCDTDATELESARLRETWSEHEGVSYGA